MRIVVDARTMGSNPSGIGIYAYHYLKELAHSEHELILLTDVETSEEMKDMREQGIRIISYGMKIYRSVQVFRYFTFVRDQLRMIQPDLFWEPNILIPKKMSGYRGKTMITIHDLFPVTLVQYFGWKYSLYFRVMLKKTIRTTDVILYDSLETREDAEHYFPELKGKKSFIQYVIVPRVQHMENHKTIELPQPVLEKGYFLYVGNMEKRKGVDLLLDSYAEYRKKGGQKALILAGKSRERDVDEKIAAVTDAYEDALYYGYVSDADKQYLYRNCDCFLFPSKAEGFGICVLEAMNYYKPILASDLSIFKEIVGDRISYFPLAGDKEAQTDSLSEGMLHYSEKIDCQGYEQAMDQYMPEPLGKRLLELLQSAGIEGNITIEE